MRKFCIAVLASIIASYVCAAIAVVSKFGPTRGTSNVTIAAAGSGKYNCLTNLDVTVDADATVRVLDGGTTTYTVVLSSGGSLVRSWDIDQVFCGSANTAMYITISAGNFNVNHQGYTY